MPVTKVINERESDGLFVCLLAHFDEFPNGECIEISLDCVDERRGIEFSIRDIPKHKALEAFYHPMVTGERVLLSGRC